MPSQSDNRELKARHIVLYIEDDEANRQLIEFIFAKRDDLRLIESETGSAGVQMAIQHRPDLILLDFSLPDMDGYAVLKLLQSNDTTCHIPVIGVSGNSTPDDMTKGVNAGLYGYLAKPVKVLELYDMIDQAIASAQ